MVAASSVDNVLGYMVGEMGFVPDKAKELTDKHSNIVERGIKFLSPAYQIADEVVNAEESRIGCALSEDYYADDAAMDD